MTDILDSEGNNASASYLLNDHHVIVGEPDGEGYLDNCERCRFAVGWVQPTSLGPDTYGHSTASSTTEVRRWIETEIETENA